MRGVYNRGGVKKIEGREWKIKIKNQQIANVHTLKKKSTILKYLTWDWTQVSQSIGKHSKDYANVQ